MLSSPTSAKELLREILQYTGYSMARISDETSISRTTLVRISHNCQTFTQLRNFNKLFRLYCRLLSRTHTHG